MKHTNFAKGLALSVGVLVFSGAISYLVLAWTAPSSTPPGNNADAPINTGAATQEKSGALKLKGELQSTLDAGYGQVRMVHGNYGAIWRNDGANTYLLFTDSGNQYGSWNSLRPFIINDSTGGVTLGQTNISRDQAGECCSGSDYTLSLAENTAGTGKKAGIQFHNSGVTEGQLRLDGGTNGRELKAYSYQTDMDLHATGHVQGDIGLCIGTDCRTEWPTGGAGDSACKEGGWVTGIENGEVVCAYGNNPAMPDRCTQILTGDNKRIFVTSKSYTGRALTNNKTFTTLNQTDINNIDARCQSLANDAGLAKNGETYKALIYAGSLREPNDVLKNYYYWIGKVAAGGGCDWELVAQNAGDFFTSKDGQYLRTNIQYNEVGESSPTIVYTNFNANGAGGYSYPQWLKYAYIGFCYRHTGVGNDWGENFYGIPNQTNYRWYNNSRTTNPGGKCPDLSGALYCVQQ